MQTTTTKTDDLLARRNLLAARPADWSTRQVLIERHHATMDAYSAGDSAEGYRRGVATIRAMRAAGYPASARQAASRYNREQIIRAADFGVRNDD